ncbi:MAG: hypothetical protein GOMPHAMPRED_006573 [Gomphillus americanus]|uniref:Uncharacterized protein n=1 Tax=Gomphillus americanus TaxID=1940652 RepID=A0A8H3FUD7_9LECA|nr:MAG: hypothetical protein GOMPHAMPRED_006573 [Gomphillus americanus]
MTPRAAQLKADLDLAKDKDKVLWERALISHEISGNGTLPAEKELDRQAYFVRQNLDMSNQSLHNLSTLSPMVSSSSSQNQEADYEKVIFKTQAKTKAKGCR